MAKLSQLLGLGSDSVRFFLRSCSVPDPTNAAFGKQMSGNANIILWRKQRRNRTRESSTKQLLVESNFVGILRCI